MANTITGKILRITPTVQIPSKDGSKTFPKREVVLDATPHDTWTGERSQYENIVPLEVSGEKCAELDNFRVGDVITVSFVLQGREWTNRDGQVKRMVSVRCYKLEARKPIQQQQTTQPVQHPIPQSATSYRQFPPQVDADGTPKDDLPF